MKLFIQIQRACLIKTFLFAATLLGVIRVSAQVPSITAISPTTAAVGATISITGANFNTGTLSNTVYVGKIRATVTSASATQLLVTVPAGIAGNARITVLNKATGLQTVSSQFFKYAFSPNKQIIVPADITNQGAFDGSSDTEAYGVISGDLDNDGKADIVITPSDPTDNRVFIRRNTSTPTAIAFVTAATITTSFIAGAQPKGEMADLDGDGKLDVVIPGYAVNYIAILHNTTTSSISVTTTSIALPSGFTSTAVATGDFDGDGKIDIVAVGDKLGSDDWLIYRNISPAPGTISFNATAFSLTNSYSGALSVSVTDFDSDGKPDIAIVVNNSSKLVVYRNTSSSGSFSFTKVTDYDFFADGFPSANSMAVGDVDGDIKPDIILTSQSTSSGSRFKALLNTSVAGTIALTQTIVDIPITPAAQTTGWAVNHTSMGDFNGDGKLDLIMNMYDGGSNFVRRVAFFTNTSTTGSISFSAPLMYQTPYFSLHTHTDIADFNDDGKPDALVSVGNNSKIVMFRNTLQFAPTITAISPGSAVSGTTVSISGSNFNTSSTNFVYFGGVASTSVVTSSSSAITATVPANAAYAPITISDGSSLLSAASTSNFLPAFTPNKTILAATDLTNQGTFSMTGQLYGMAAADLDKDGDPDLITINSSGNGSLVIYPNSSANGGVITFTGSTTLSLTGALSSPALRYVSIADLDGNGYLDLVVPNSGLSTVGVYLNPGTGSLSGFTLTGTFGTAMGPIGAATGDFDGDGKIDIVTSNFYGANVSVLRNISTGTGSVNFEAKKNFSISGSEATYDVAVADIDNDGKPDIIGGRDINTDPGKLSILRNISTLGNINFEPVQYFDGPEVPWSFRPADFDGDGLIDLVASAGNGTIISVYRNTTSGGTINFTKQDLAVVNRNTAVAVADINGDGKPDVISASVSAVGGIYYTRIYPNTSSSGSISFGTRVDLPGTTTTSPWNMVATDMNNDGKPDIIVGNQFDVSNSNISTFRNTLILPPTIQASNITTTATGTSASLTWTIGNGNKRAVFIKTTNAGTAAPVTLTDYIANTVFGSGSEIVGTGWYCVYNGTGTSVTVTGLTPATTYRAMVTEFNDGGFSNTAQYNTNATTNNPVNITTRATITAISRTTASTTINTSTAAFSVTFNATVTGLSTSNFSLTTSGVTGASVTAVSGSGSTFTVTVNTGSGNGTIGLNLSNTTGMSTDVTNALPFAGQIYTIDKTAPTLSPVTIVSNNGNTAKAKTGNIITLAFSSSETISTPAVTLSGNTVTVTNTGANNWSASYTMTGSDAEGTVAFNIGFSDLVGNTGTAVTSTTNSSSVVFDRTAPTLPSVTISSSNSNASLAFTGDIITLNFTAGETIATPVVTIAGATATVTNTGGNNWKATYTITGAEAGGIIPFNIAFSDITGNAGTAVTATTNSSSVIHDKTAPTLSIVTIASSNSNAALAFTGDIITVNFTSSEAILTPAVTIAGGTATVTNTGANNWKATYTITGSEAGGTIAFNISFSDLNSNAGTAVTATTNSSSVTHDKTAPTLTLVSIASNNTNPAKAKTGNTVTLSFTSSEAIQTPTVTIAGGTATITNTSSNNWTATYSMSNNDTEGTIAFTIGFSDLNNNAGTTVNATTNSSAVVFDKTNPLLSSTTITTSNPNNNRLSKTGDLVTVGITANEPIIPVSATIAGHAVSVTNSSGNTWTASYTMTSADTEGTIDFNINYTDFSGNTGSPAVTPSNGIRAIFDKTNPTLPGVTIASLSTPDAGRARPNDFVRISITGSEDLLAPMVTIAGNTIIASQNGGATTWSASYRMTNTDPEGLIAFSVAFSDATGNSGTTVTSTTNNSSVVFDRTAPLVTSLTIVSNNANPARAKVGDKITATMIVNESILTPTIVIAGQSTTPVYNGNNTWAATYTMTSTDGTQTVGVQTSFRDLSSNTGSSSTTTDNSSVIFDKTAPALTAVTILSTGPSYTAIPGDKITIDFASSETISAPVVSIAGHLVTAANTSGNSWKATYTMTNTDATGIVPFSIAFSDLSGNAGTVVTATTNNSSVLFSIPGSGPPFTNGTSQTMSMCQDAPAVDINSMMSVNAAAGTTLTWSVTKQPSLGKLTGFNATMISSGGTAVPSGMSYTPTAKFYGTDAFIVQVSDGVNTATTTVNVTINQLPALAITGSPILCEGLTTTLSANANNASSFIWLRNGVQISNVSGATLTVSDLGTYTAYAVSAAGCQSVISNGVTMLFYAKPKLSVSSVDVSCINIPVTFTSTSTVSTVTLALTSWNDGNGGVSVSGNAATFTYTQPGTYNVKFKVTPSSCRTLADSVIKPITIEAIPKAAFSAAAISCVNLPVLFTNQSTVSNSATVTYNWSDNNGHTSTSTSPTFTYSQAGSFAMKLKVTPQACPANADSIVQTISIVTATSGVRLATANVITGKLSQLEARNQTGASYNWTPNTGLISVSIYNPQILTTKQEQYLIVMTLPGGCTTTDTLLVRVQAPSATVLVPNVFTPNGDGQNDKLTPTLVASIKTLSFFRVFNRWGKMLYETKQIGQGWDGKYNGILQPLDTYTWVIEGFDTNDQKVKKQGSVTLLR